MAEVHMPAEAEKVCVNCTYYSWEHPEDKSTILLCSKCKFASYCSKQCQVEHWHNVHKKHCKYQAGIKVMPMAWHNEASCLQCRREKEAGRLDISESDNSVLPCTLSQTNQALTNTSAVDPLAFAYAEMSGQFLTKVEASFTMMMRILLKMKMTKHIVWSSNANITQKLYEGLNDGRERCWIAYSLARPGPRLDDKMATIAVLKETIHETFKLMEKIDQQLLAIQFEEKKELKPWETLKLLVTFLMNLKLGVGRGIGERLGLPEMPEDLLSTRISSFQFNNKWQMILDMLGGGLVTYRTLIEVLAGGSTVQECYGCSRQVTVMSVETRDMDNLGGEEQPVLLFNRTTILSLCGVDCRYNLFTRANIVGADDSLGTYYGRMGFEFFADMCDFCSLHYRGARGHRCSRCLTKVYCGAECRDKDWVVHRLVCREGEEVRKQKGGQQERWQKGSDRFEKVLNDIEMQRL